MPSHSSKGHELRQKISHSYLLGFPDCLGLYVGRLLLRALFEIPSNKVGIDTLFLGRHGNKFAAHVFTF